MPPPQPMAGDDLDDDVYVANLLREDAKTAAKKYEFVGLGAFNPQRSANRAPRPNTSFLRNIIRQTDSHNAALLAKEAEESRARLKEMNLDRGQDRRGTPRGHGRLTPLALSDVDDRRPAKRKRSDYYDSDTETDRERERKRKLHRESRHRDSGKDRELDRGRHRKKDKRRQDDSEEDGFHQTSRHSRRDQNRKRRHRRDKEEDKRHSKRRERSRHRDKREESDARASSGSRSRSRSPHSYRYRKSSRQRDGHRSRSRTRVTGTRDSGRTSGKTSAEKRSPKRVPSVPGSDSDPLEAIVGPLPPPPQPAVRSRGRGAHKASSVGMDAKFSSAYDPTVDVRADSDIEDDWGDAVERSRDQQKWKQSGAERLRQAGFTDEQIKKWEKGDEKTEEDVVWAARGSTKEWDRGKVIGEDGDVTLKADFGRLT
ncbi:hypothetical protein BDV96DRAFT_652096 [Lophiotrema nucula]|uniref:Pre-mRNA-splicing factor 38B n=1 Tax=Lophiotrema nucula TaxID=690887 RepID=A0A6A5YQ82_9PLEO|nr:hypothetical protein BDV96DRAFT_652096 [Lophiotrema nucula]